MQIKTNYNLPSTRTKITPQVKKTVASEQVVLGGHVTDNNLTMADQIKHMKSFRGNAPPEQVLGSIFSVGTGLVVGGTVGSIGTAAAANVIGGVVGTRVLGLSFLGGAIIGGYLAGCLANR